MGTLTMTTAGFGGGATTPNGSRAATMSDADFIRLIAWAKIRTAPPGVDSRTSGQVLNDFIGAEWVAWRDAIQNFERQPPVVPAPITIG